jgi:hypothetical protein
MTITELAAIVAMDDDALRARLAQLEAVAITAGTPEDDLTEAGHAELYALQDERDRRWPRCGLCARRVVLAPGRSICADCAFFPLD